MSHTVLFIELLLVHYAIQTQTEVNCGENVTLTCPDVDFNNLNFISVTWYKIDNQKKSGIIRKVRGAESPEPYNFPRQAGVGDDYSLFMASVTPGDSGRYECGVSASVGGQNVNRQVDLMVHVCVTTAQVTSTTTVTNMNEFTTISQKQVTDLPIMWSVIGYLAVGCTKVILCVITIWTCAALKALLCVVPSVDVFAWFRLGYENKSLKLGNNCGIKKNRTVHWKQEMNSGSPVHI